jgi:2-succinyl-5-enolpyruvyl-6-hydroxy-3-cyclohexene-1-carboxylate synthase
MSASNKDEFEKVYQRFFIDKVTDKPMLFEVFTNSDEESNALETMMTFCSNASGKAKNIVKSVLGEKGIKTIKGILGK